MSNQINWAEQTAALPSWTKMVDYYCENYVEKIVAYYCENNVDEPEDGTISPREYWARAVINAAKAAGDPLWVEEIMGVEAQF